MSNVVQLKPKVTTDLNFFESVEAQEAYKKEEEKLRDKSLTPLDPPFSWRELMELLKFWR